MGVLSHLYSTLLLEGRSQIFFLSLNSWLVLRPGWVAILLTFLKVCLRRVVSGMDSSLSLIFFLTMRLYETGMIFSRGSGRSDNVLSSTSVAILAYLVILSLLLLESFLSWSSSSESNSLFLFASLARVLACLKIAVKLSVSSSLLPPADSAVVRVLFHGKLSSDSLLMCSGIVCDTFMELDDASGWE